MLLNKLFVTCGVNCGLKDLMAIKPPPRLVHYYVCAFLNDLDCRASGLLIALLGATLILIIVSKANCKLHA